MKNQKGFTELILLVIIAALVGAGVYFVSTKRIIPSVTLSEPTLQSKPKINLPVDGVLSVVNLTSNKELYLNKQVRVHGKIHINIFYGELPCKEYDELICDTTLGAQLELWQEELVSGAENFILLLKNGKSSCEKVAPGKYECGRYTSYNDQLITVSGVWQKDREAVGWVGGGGKPLTPTQWQDRYFLNIE